MTRRKQKDAGEHPKLDMTPMIDVVFQLLIFFVVTLKQDDIFSKLSTARPTSNPREIDTPIELVSLVVSAQGFVMNGRSMTYADVDRQLGRVSAVAASAPVTLKCTADSPHALLVQALDLCHKHGLTHLSVFSL